MGSRAISRIGRRAFLKGSAAVFGSLALGPGSAPAADGSGEPVRIGDINSYTHSPSVTGPMRNGWTLAMDRINARGGVLGGRRLEVVCRDDNGSGDGALVAARDVMSHGPLAALMGGLRTEVGLALADYALKNRIPFIGSGVATNALTWEKGNRYTFRLRPSVWMQATALARQAATCPGSRWVTVAPEGDYGRSAVVRFKSLLRDLRPDVKIVTEHWQPVSDGRSNPTTTPDPDVAAAIRTLQRARPDGLFNALTGDDLFRFVQEGAGYGLFDGCAVVSLSTGEPECLSSLGAEGPEGWIVSGYPVDRIDTPAHNAFVDAYRGRFGAPPTYGALLGYSVLMSVVAALEKAGSTDGEPVTAAMKGLECDTPCGPVVFRAEDHQSTMGVWVGRTARNNGQTTMVDARYIDGGDLLPPADAVVHWRPDGQ